VLEIRAHAMRAMGSRACRRWPLLLLLCRIAPVPAALLGRAPIRISLASPPRCRRTIPACAADKQQLLLPRLGPVPELPVLSDDDVRVLSEGKFLQRQILDGPDGSGFAVQEIRASPDEAWHCVSDFDGYAQRIKTVRTVSRYTPEPDSRFGALAPGETCYDFLVSRIRLPLAVRFTMHDVATERYVTWVLDRPSWVLRESTGYWHVQVVPDRPGYVRVWFCVAVRLTARVPRFVVGLVSRLGLRKACYWVRGALSEGGGDGGADLGDQALPEPLV